VPVLEDLNVGIYRISALNALRELHGAVMQIGVAHEAADKSDNDTGRRGRRPGTNCAVGCHDERCGGGHHKGQNQNPGCGEAKQAGS
jgi:hypothetical protein